MNEINALKQKIAQSSFEEQGEIYAHILEFAKTLQTPYRTWRLQHFEHFISQHTPITTISIVLDVDVEDDLYELWGLTLHLPQQEYYLPIHWLNSSWLNYHQSPFATEITHWLTNIPLEVSQELWQHLQKIVALLWEDLASWKNTTYIYKRK